MIPLGSKKDFSKNNNLSVDGGFIFLTNAFLLAVEPATFIKRYKNDHFDLFIVFLINLRVDSGYVFLTFIFFLVAESAMCMFRCLPSG